MYGGEDIRALYLDVPTDKETIAYRRQVTEDLRDPAMYRGLWQYAKEMKKATGYEKNVNFAVMICSGRNTIWMLCGIFAKAVEKTVIRAGKSLPHTGYGRINRIYKTVSAVRVLQTVVAAGADAASGAGRGRGSIYRFQKPAGAGRRTGKNSLEDRFYQAFSIEKRGMHR